MDRRELILDGLFTALQTVPGILSAYRNRGELPEDKRPAITMLDSDEQAVDRPHPQGRLTAIPHLVVMRPEIYVVMDQREPKNIDIGQDLNEFRKQILKVTLWNETLRGLTGSNGEIRYMGCLTDLSSGRSLQGQMQVLLDFVYPLHADRLVA